MTGIPIHQTDDFSNLTLQCDSKAFKVHKIILGSGSSVFMSTFKENFKEATTGIVPITEFDETTVQYMLDFCYSGEVHIEAPGCIDPGSEEGGGQFIPSIATFLTQLIEVSLIAECYDIPGLYNAAIKLINDLEPNEVSSMFADIANDFMEVIYNYYDRVNVDLKKSLVSMAAKHLNWENADGLGLYDNLPCFYIDLFRHNLEKR